MFGCFLLGQCHVGLTVCRCREDKPPAQTGPSQAREREMVLQSYPQIIPAIPHAAPHQPATSQRNFKLYCHTSSKFELLASFSPDSLIVVIVKSAIFSKMCCFQNPGVCGGGAA